MTVPLTPNDPDHPFYGMVFDEVDPPRNPLLTTAENAKAQARRTSKKGSSMREIPEGYNTVEVHESEVVLVVGVGTEYRISYANPYAGSDYKVTVYPQGGRRALPYIGFHGTWAKCMDYCRDAVQSDLEEIR